MTDEPAGMDLGSVDTKELLSRVGMLHPDTSHRSNPLLDPSAFKELARRLNNLIDEPYDAIVVRDLFGDKMLGYELALESGNPVFVSVDREGIIALERTPVEGVGNRALIAADLHFTPQSIQAARVGLESSGLTAIGVALLMQLDKEDDALPLWKLEGHL